MPCADENRQELCCGQRNCYVTIKSLSAHFAISCVFRKRGELEDRAPSHTREATGRYELPAHSEAAVTETRCL